MDRRKWLDVEGMISGRTEKGMMNVVMGFAFIKNGSRAIQ